jgi:hypothetical protein
MNITTNIAISPAKANNPMYKIHSSALSLAVFHETLTCTSAYKWSKSIFAYYFKYYKLSIFVNISIYYIAMN